MYTHQIRSELSPFSIILVPVIYRKVAKIRFSHRDLLFSFQPSLDWLDLESQDNGLIAMDCSVPIETAQQQTPVFDDIESFLNSTQPS